MKRILTLLLALAASASLSAQVFLTSFGSDDFIDYSGSLDQSQSSAGFSGTLMFSAISGDFLAGPIDIRGNTSALALTATVFDNPATLFEIQLIDVDYNAFRYAGAWGDFVTGMETTALLYAIDDQSGAFDFSQVIGLDFAFDGGSSDTINVTLSGLAAVPEPSTYAALAGLIGLGYAVIARRRRGDDLLPRRSR